MKAKRGNGRDAILYVEDDRNDIVLLKQAIKEAALHNPLQVVEDGERAIEYLAGKGEFADRARFPLPALVLLDLNLPRKNGLEVLAWIRADKGLHALPVIIFSSSFLGTDIARAYRLGANSFIVKPCDYNELCQVAHFLKSWLHHNMMPPVDERDWIALMARDLESHWPGAHKPAD